MTGPAIIVFVLLVGLPVTFMISGAIVAVAIGQLFPDDDSTESPAG